MNEMTTLPCSHCGAHVPATVQYCPSCGKPAPSGEATDGSERETLKDAIAPVDVSPPPVEQKPDVRAIVPAPTGLYLDWEPELIALVEEAATLKGTTVEALIRSIVEDELRRFVKKRRGMITLDKATDILGVTKREVVQKINSGELIARKVDGEWMLDKDALGETEKRSGDMAAQLELDLRELANSAGLEGVDLDSLADDSVSATLCYVNQEGVLICPREAWRKLGRKQVLAEAKDAVRRFIRRRDQDLGRI